MSTHYDSSWKEALDAYFEPFMALLFAEIHRQIDWSHGYESLDKEFQQMVREAKIGRRYIVFRTIGAKHRGRPRGQISHETPTFTEERTRPMSANLLRIAVGLAIVTAAAGANPQPPKNNGNAPAEPARNPQLEKKAKDLALQYEQNKKQFVVARNKASDKIASRFDAVIKKYRTNTRMPADVRRAKEKELSDEKKAFLADGKLPLSEEMIGPLLDYQMELDKAYSRFARTYEPLYNLYSTKLKDDARANKLAADKESFDQKSRGRTVFGPSHWHGTQHGGNNISFVLDVGALEGNNIKGRIVQNRYPGETVFKVEGLLRGNRIELDSTKVIQGGARRLKFIGFVMENRIVGQVVSMATNGKMSPQHLVVLHKR